STTDWQADLEYRVAKGFQLALFLADFLANTSNRDLLARDNNVDRCIAMALTSLRDIAGVGANKTPEGLPFAGRLLQAELTPAEFALLTDTVWMNIDTALFPDDGSSTGLQKWVEFLRRSLPVEAQDLRILNAAPFAVPNPATPPAPITADESIAQ